jgi:hypothetical protein
MLIKTTSMVNQNQKKVFDYIVPIDLNHIFKKYKYLPGVLKTDEQSKWITEGLTRTVFFEDGNTAQETLTKVIESSFFAYIVKDFTSPLKFLIDRINGSWNFEDINNAQTNITWIYELVPKNYFCSVLLSTFVKNDVQQLCKNAMDIIVEDLKN